MTHAASERSRRGWSLAVGIVAAAAVIGAAPRRAAAATYRYVDWTVADVAAGTASGTITLPDASVVTVTFAATTPTGAAGNLYGAQTTAGGTNYWMPSAPYISTQVDNAPPGTDILQLLGGQNQTYTVTLSEPIKDPIMAIVSLGQSAQTITYNFTAPFTIVSQGVGYWGGSATALVQLPNNVLQGSEGHGTIQFIGTFATFAWTVPNPEGWHGFTFAIRTTERLEPTPDAGADGGGAGGAAGGGVAGAGGASGAGGAGGSAGAAVAGAAGSAAGMGGAGVGGSAGGAGVGGSAGGAGAGGSAGGAGVGGSAGGAGIGGSAGGAGVGGSAGGAGGNAGAAAGGRGGGNAGAGGSATGGAGGAGVRRGGDGCGCGLGGDATDTTVLATGLGLLMMTLVRRRRRRRPS